MAAAMVAATMALATAAGAAEDAFLRQWAETNRFRLGRPAAIEIAPDGDAVFFLRSPARSFVRDLYVFDTATGKERVLLRAEDLLGGGEEELTAEEKARRERQRLAARGIAAFALSPDGGQILVPLSGQLYLYDRKKASSRKLAGVGGYPLDPRFSGDGRHLGYVIDGDFHVYELATGQERKLTAKEGPDISYGLAEFAAQEEMDRDQGYWFSPDGRAVAVQRNDDQDLELFHIPDPADPAKAPQPWRYPRAGQANTRVGLFVIPLDGGPRVEVAWDQQYFPYLATVEWTADGPLTLVVQDRDQENQAVLQVDPATGVSRELFRESDSAWINLDQDMPRWLPGGPSSGQTSKLLWTSERGGGWQLELRDQDGKHLRWLTPAGFIYQGLVGVDAEAGEVWIKGSESPLDCAIYRLPLDPGPGGPRPPRRVGESEGLADAVSVDQGTQVRTLRPPDGRHRFEVWTAAGKKAGELTSVAELPDFALNAEWRQVALESGQGRPTPYHAVVVRPRNFQRDRKYPVIVQVYGGPHNQMVRHDGANYFFAQWLADRAGAIVVSIDGRGTLNRGREWERAIDRDLIGPALDDQVRVLQALGRELPELDLGRVGIFGWSFGGYFSALAVMLRPDVFHAAVAGAPVADWELYDTHYTERYLGLPKQQPEAYRRSSVLQHAPKLARPLLIVHGTADDNVYLVHSLRLADALFKAGREFEFLPLANTTHQLTDPAVVIPVWQRVASFFDRHLGADPQPEPR